MRARWHGKNQSTPQAGIGIGVMSHRGIEETIGKYRSAGGDENLKARESSSRYATDLCDGGK